MRSLTKTFHTAAIACSLTLASLLTVSAQSIEIRGQINSGFYAYRGASAKHTTNINDAKYTNSPYGRKGAVSYGASFNIKRVTKNNFILGGDLGYEMLRSKVSLDFQDGLGGDIIWTFRGRTFLNNGFINIFPFIGKRIRISSQPVDITIGSDIGFLTNSKEKGKATATQQENIVIKTSQNRDKHINTDVRPRIQVSTDFKKVGVYAGYSYGISNYYKDFIGGKNNEVYSRMLRLGISYRLK